MTRSPLRTEHPFGAAPESLMRLAEAEDALRAIAAGEVDALVVSDGRSGRRVLTLSGGDRPYRLFLENMHHGAATLSPTGLVLYANRRLVELLACSRSQVVGSPLAQFVAAGSYERLLELRDRASTATTLELDLLDRDGRHVPVVAGSSHLDGAGVARTCMTFTDLRAQKAEASEHARANQDQADEMADLQVAHIALTEKAAHDTLTGLPNRSLLVGRIEQALLHAQRSGRSIAVLFIDLDRFKQINDTLGHAAGDAVLRAVGERLVAVLRPADTVARIGGDEFAILAPDIEDLVAATELSTRVIVQMCGPNGTELGEPVGASVGISVSAGGRGTAEILLHEADTAMYRAKALGGGRTEIFHPALGRLHRDRAIAQRMLRTALDQHRIVVHYQPLVDLSTGEITGFEGLARIAASDGSLLPPAAFVPAAERNGLAGPLGSEVLAIACGEARRWSIAALSPSELTISVNLSAHQFSPGDLPAIVERRLQQTGLRPECLHLELTETAVIDLDPDTLLQLELIRDLGVQIGLDDYGLGYASLTHLRRLPLTFVKIDQSFVQSLGTSNDDARIVSAVVELAANLGLRSIAEGIETDDQLRRLRACGCDQAQGFLFARPMPSDEVPAMVGSAGI
jgi:diguanylate cyclase (GGDEF)-like protein